MLYDEAEEPADLHGVVDARGAFRNERRLQQAIPQVRNRQEIMGQLLDGLPAAIFTTDTEGRVTFYNRAAADLAGREPELEKDRWSVAWRQHRPDGREMPRGECPLAIALKDRRPVGGAESVAERPDGTRVPFLAYSVPLRGWAGAPMGALNMLIDIAEHTRAQEAGQRLAVVADSAEALKIANESAERKQAQEHQDLLLGEMDHRIGNLFAVTNGLVAMSARFARTPQELAWAIRDRLEALARAQAIIRPRPVEPGRRSGGETTLDALVQAIFAPYDDRHRANGWQRVFATGAPAPVGANAAIGVALVLHELATNSVKYGALSVAEGAVHVEWSTQRGELLLKWEERGGPRLGGPPAHEGFGTVLARRTIGSGLGGRISRDWRPEGLTVSLSIPLERLAQ